MSLSVAISEPEEFFHWRTGVDWIPSATVAVHNSWYICPAISLPAVLMETVNDEGGTAGRRKCAVHSLTNCG